MSYLIARDIHKWVCTVLCTFARWIAAPISWQHYTFTMKSLDDVILNIFKEYIFVHNQTKLYLWLFIKLLNSGAHSQSLVQEIRCGWANAGNFAELLNLIEIVPTQQNRCSKYKVVLEHFRVSSITNGWWRTQKCDPSHTDTWWLQYIRPLDARLSYNGESKIYICLLLTPVAWKVSKWFWPPHYSQL